MGLKALFLDAPTGCAGSGNSVVVASDLSKFLAHRFNNTLGFLRFFLVGSIHGLW